MWEWGNNKNKWPCEQGQEYMESDFTLLVEFSAYPIETVEKGLEESIFGNESI